MAARLRPGHRGVGPESKSRKRCLLLERLIAPVRWVVWSIAVVVWAVVGFLVWVPFLIRLTAKYLLTLLSNVLRDAHLEEAVADLHRAITFYVDGFDKTTAILRPERKAEGGSRSRGLGLRGLARVGGEVVYTTGFWLLVFFLVGRMPVRMSGACIPLTPFCFVRESADEDLVGKWQNGTSRADDWRSMDFDRSGSVRVGTTSGGGSEESFRSGRFYTNGDTLLVVMSSPNDEVVRLRYDVRSDRLVLSEMNGAAAGRFDLVEADEDSRIRRLVSYDWVGQGRRLWDWISTRVRSLLPDQT